MMTLKRRQNTEERRVGKFLKLDTKESEFIGNFSLAY